jgi:hypothetical protein
MTVATLDKTCVEVVYKAMRSWNDGLAVMEIYPEVLLLAPGSSGSRPAA